VRERYVRGILADGSVKLEEEFDVARYRGVLHLLQLYMQRVAIVQHGQHLFAFFSRLFE